MKHSILLGLLTCLFAGCGMPFQQDPSAALGPSGGEPTGFMAAVEAVIQDIRAGGWVHEIRIDPRPIPDDVRSPLTEVDLRPDNLGLEEERSRQLEAAGLATGDLIAAQECNHVFGLGGLLIAPLSEAQEELAERCTGAFDGFTMGVSTGVETQRNGDTVEIYTVLVLGSDAEQAWTVTVDANGEVVALDQFMLHMSE